MVADRNVASPGLVVLASLLARGGVAGTARADRIVLRGGTTIRGVVLPTPGPAGQVLVQTESLTTPIKYRKEQIVEVISEPSALKDYLDRRDQTASDAPAQYELGLWCEEHKLSAFAESHYRRAIELDKSYAPAHKKLGHVLHSDQWITGDQLREAQGLVKVRGKWISTEEKAKVDAEAAASAEKAAWARRLKVLRQALVQGSLDRRKSAEEQLSAIRDPAAVTPLVKVFGEDPEALRTLLAQILGGIPGDEAAAALTARVLAEADPGVREATMDVLTRREETNIVPQLVRALRSRDPAVINRAAWALANLQAVSAVPKLVQALVLTEERIIWTPPENVGGGGGNIGVGFSSMAPLPLANPGGLVATGAMDMPSSVGIGTGAGSASFGVTVPFGVLNSVAVAPGVVAFGGGPGYLPGYGTGMGMSVGESGPTRGYQPKLVSFTLRNVEVLNALKKLTGQNFGYDLGAWRHWLTTAFRPDPEPARRVRQP
jgi:hypothetical protein